MDDMTNSLIKAIEYEADRLHVSEEEERPFFHVNAPVGWMNDPNGFSVYQGEYHLFYQYHPYSTQWGPMHWGHMKTRDFVKWTRLPVALAPDQPYDKDGCFSGTAIEVGGRHILAYTGVTDDFMDNGRHLIRQTQCLAVGDGLTYTKLPDNPVITGEMLGEDCSKQDFRDPKLFEREGLYYMLVANRSMKSGGQLLLFQSEDLVNWSGLGAIEQPENKLGEMWECPDLFQLDQQIVLFASIQDMEAEGLEFHSGNNTLYFLGEFKENKFYRAQTGVLDYGMDFYAAQTIRAVDGRRIMTAWMQSWDTRLLPDHLKWNGMMILPRELSLQNGKLCQEPVREIKKYWGKAVLYQNQLLESAHSYPKVQGRCFDLTVTILEGNYQYLEIRMAKSGNKYVSIVYFPELKILRIDRKYTSLKRDYVTERCINLEPVENKVTLRILLDRYSVEVFANHGIKVMTMLYCMDNEAEDVEFLCRGECRVDIDFHSISNA